MTIDVFNIIIKIINILNHSFSKMDSPENTNEEAQNPDQFHFEIKGDLEELMDTVIAFYPISLYDYDKQKLEKKYDTSTMYKEFKKKYLDKFVLPDDTDEYRPPYANTYYGGVDFSDAKTTGLIRGIGWDLVKQIGQKILSGDFNLTTVTIPIKVMVPISVLQHVCNAHFNFPLYLNLAAQTEDPIEQMKYVITACISSWFKSLVFLKPLNPILGETYEMLWEDGSREYVEQTSHHPPRSHFLLLGPENNYKYHGYVDFTSNAWFNSMTLTNKGTRTVEFKNQKSKIKFNYAVDQYSNTFWGCFRHEAIGEMTFVDEINGYKAELSLGKVSGKFSDFFEGTIEKDDEIISEFSGSYLSYIEFDEKRYWDIRRNINIEAFPVKDQIKSSSVYREDAQLLYQKKNDEAQEAKNNLENIQRKDRKLRAQYAE